MNCPTTLPADPALTADPVVTAARAGDEGAWLELYDLCAASLYDRLSPMGPEQALGRLVGVFDQVLTATSATTVRALLADLDVAAGGELAAA